MLPKYLLSLLLALGACVAWSPRASAADPPTVSLDELVRRVKASNPVVGIARARLADYTALFDKAYYAWIPRISVDGFLAPLPERRLLRQCVVGVHDSGAPLVGVCPGQEIRDDEILSADTELGILVQTEVKITFPIYTFGKIDSAQRAARAGIEIGEAGVDYARGQLEYLVRKAYYGAQLAASVLDILADGRKRMNEVKEKISDELEKESGRFTSNDLRKLLIEQAEIEVGYLETEALRGVAWEGLRIAGGFEYGEPFKLDSLKLVAVHVEARTPEAYLELAMLSRPDLRMAEAAVRARAGQVDMAEAEFLPNIALVAGAGIAKGTTAEDNPDPFASDDYNYTNFGVVLGAEWGLDFGGMTADLRHAKAVLKRQTAERDALKLKVQLEVISGVGQMRRYSAELGVREVAMKAAKAWLVSNTLNFGLGLAKTDELLKSLVAYNKARLKYFRTIYEYDLAVASLARTVGTELAVPAPTR